ncbi:hypothetical protein [Salinimicrobium gaetbulicola]|uniref:Uncharacterized protein n=1 Tax=Salinimicrobium gaetbulicola TaxID=999702 RepID=A0ABW3IDE0_9FLAO
MKTITIKFLGLLLFLITGCNVYHSSNASVEEAVRSQKRVQVVSTDNVFYEFKRLQKQDGQLMGVTAPNSDTAKLLRDHRSTQNGKTIMIHLDEEEISEIHLRNTTASNLVNFGVPAALVGGVVVLTAADINTGGSL